jgi:hypothetical protein
MTTELRFLQSCPREKPAFCPPLVRGPSRAGQHAKMTGYPSSWVPRSPAVPHPTFPSSRHWAEQTWLVAAPTESCPRQQPGRSSSGPAIPGGLHGDHSRCPSTSRTKTGLHRPAMRLRCTCHRPQSPVIRGQPTQQCSLGLLGSGLAAGGCWGPRPGGFGAWQGRPGAAASSGEIASDPE